MPKYRLAQYRRDEAGNHTASIIDQNGVTHRVEVSLAPNITSPADIANAITTALLGRINNDQSDEARDGAAMIAIEARINA